MPRHSLPFVLRPTPYGPPPPPLPSTLPPLPSTSFSHSGGANLSFVDEDPTNRYRVYLHRDSFPVATPAVHPVASPAPSETPEFVGIPSRFERWWMWLRHGRANVDGTGVVVGGSGQPTYAANVHVHQEAQPAATPSLSLLAYRPSFQYDYVHSDDCRCPDVEDHYARQREEERGREREREREREMQRERETERAAELGQLHVTEDGSSSLVVLMDGPAVEVEAAPLSSSPSASINSESSTKSSSSSSSSTVVSSPVPPAYPVAYPAMPSSPICNWEGDWDSILCPLCACVFDQARTTSCCGVEVCLNCVHHWSRHRRSERCPFCRGHLSERTLLPASDKQARVDCLEVRCPFSSLGCGWTGPRIALRRHVMWCEIGLAKSDPTLVATEIDPPRCLHPYCAVTPQDRATLVSLLRGNPSATGPAAAPTSSAAAALGHLRRRVGGARVVGGPYAAAGTSLDGVVGGSRWSRFASAVIMAVLLASATAALIGLLTLGGIEKGRADKTNGPSLVVLRSDIPAIAEDGNAPRVTAWVVWPVEGHDVPSLEDIVAQKL
ncbi:hypothetical protein HK101_009919 [Irineochytrium annulatum]|nr:hypothetical protein HK101_009919 [Irineochytrium annulatum]